ncbi:MAG: MBL fold metallo-hydrolase [Ruminococcaceae bacterium]|nr:MBL fold metallo-hydrolase [Oscillospiraceae bacterium]
MEMPKIETTVIKINDYITAIDQMMVRSFLITGMDSALLLDAGAENMDLPALVSQLTKLPVTLCMTHSDGDHTAALGRFDSALAHVDEIPLLMSRQPEIKTLFIPVEDGHVFDLGGIVLRVIHNPGHTPGSISLLDEKNKALFSGDTVSFGPVFMFGANRNMDDFENSLNKLKAVCEEYGVDTIYPCHNTCPITPECIVELLACVKGIKDGTLEGHEPKGDLPPGENPIQYTVGSSGIYVPR